MIIEVVVEVAYLCLQIQEEEEEEAFLYPSLEEMAVIHVLELLEVEASF
jgi:hypothetical protein